MPPIPQAEVPTRPKVVIVDADRRVQQSLADLLGVTGEVDVVGRAGTVRAALQEIERSRPDAVLVDPRLPDLEAGLALITGLTRAWPAMRIVLTGWSDAEGHAQLADTTCYVSKDGSPETFISALVHACQPG